MDNTTTSSHKRKYKERDSSVVTTNETSSKITTVRTTKCTCAKSTCVVCRVSDPESSELRECKRRKVTESGSEIMDSTSDEEEMEDSPLATFIDTIVNDSGKVHEVMINTSLEKIMEYSSQGSSFCDAFCCLSELTKDNVPVYMLLQRVGESVKCGKRGACRYKCVGACQRHASYQAYARHAGAKERSVLPTCVRLFINALYGPSVVGYKATAEEKL